MELNIVEKLLGMTLLGTEWVLWLLLFSSIVSVAVMIERAWYYKRLKIDYRMFSES